MATDGPACGDFEDFVKGYADRAFRFAYRLCGNAEDAREYVQESFLKVLRAWDGLEPGGTFESWYFSVLRNVAFDGKRRADRRREVPLDMPLPGADADLVADRVADGAVPMLDALESGERDRLVRAALDALPLDQRRVLVLVDMEGRSYDDIARIVKAPVGTVRSRVSRARSAFRRALSGKSEVEP